MYLAIVAATIIVFLIAVYVATKKREPEATDNFSKKERMPGPEAKKPKIQEYENLIGENQEPAKEEQPKSESKPPFRPPSEPEIL